MHHTGVQQRLRKRGNDQRILSLLPTLKKKVYYKVHKSQQSLQPNPTSSAKQHTKLFAITAKQCAAAAALAGTGHPFGWLPKGDFADSERCSVDVQEQVTSTSAHLFLRVSEEVLKNSRQDDIAQDRHLQFAFRMKSGS